MGALAAIPAAMGMAGAGGAAAAGGTGAALGAGAATGAGVTAAGLGSGAIGTGMTGAGMAASALPGVTAGGAGMGAGMGAAGLGASAAPSFIGQGSPLIGQMQNMMPPGFGGAMQGNADPMAFMQPPQEIAQVMAPYQGMMRGETPSITSFAPPPSELQGIMSGFQPGGGSTLTAAPRPPMPEGMGLRIPPPYPVSSPPANMPQGGPYQVPLIEKPPPWVSATQSAAQVMASTLGRNQPARLQAPLPHTNSTVAAAPNMAQAVVKRASPVERYLALMRR